MSVLSSSGAKTRERVRLHTQLGNFPLLAEAVVVRTSKTKDGYRWALRFDRIDDATRANLEAFVRQQLANAARVRQAQLYAARMKSAPLPGATPAPTWPTPAPVSTPVPPTRSAPTPPPVGEAPPNAREDAGEPPAGSVPLEIELPDIAPPPPPSRTAPPAAAPAAYTPYAGDAEQDADALGTLSPAPEPVSRPPAPGKAPQTLEAPAPAFDPGVADAEEAELLLGAPSDEPMTSPAPASSPAPAAPTTPAATDVRRSPPTARNTSVPEAKAAAVAPAPSLPASPRPPAPDGSPTIDATANSAALSAPDSPGGPPSTPAAARPKATPQRPSSPQASPGMVWELDAEALDEEVSFAAVLAEADEMVASASEPQPQDTLVMSSGDMDAEPLSVALGSSDDEAPVAAPDPSDRQETFERSASRGPAAGAPSSVAVGGHEESDGISLADLEGQPAAAGPMDDASAPALVGAPFDLSSDADDDAVDLPLQSAAPDEVAPLFSPTPDPSPATHEAPPRAPASAPEPVGVSEVAPSSAPLPAPAQEHDFNGMPFDAGPAVDPGSTEELGAAPGMGLGSDDAVLGSLEDAAAPLLPDASLLAPPVEAPESAPTTATTPAVSDAPPAPARPSQVSSTPASPPAPAPAPQASRVRPPAPPVYGDVVAPYDPYAPNPEPSALAMAKYPDVGSAPRTIGELPPAVEGLYTPASNPSLHGSGDSGLYESASFQPFPSPTEEGLYGGESSLSFEDRRDDPRQRLAKLQVKVRPEPTQDDDSSMYLGDIEGATSGLTPTHAKMLRTDEDLSGAPFVDTPMPDTDMPTSVHLPQDGAGAPASIIDAMPTGPVDLGISDYTPAPFDPNDSAVDAPYAVGGSHLPEALATAPGFAPVPDYEQPPPPSDELDDPLMRPAQSGQTIVASTELVDLASASPATAVPPLADPGAPSDFQVLPAFAPQGDQPSNFTVVAGFEDMASSTMIATAAQIEAWRRSEAAAAPPNAFDDEANTSYFTPAPGALAPILPPDVEGAGGETATAIVGAPALGTGLDEAALTAMRVHPGGGGAMPGAGFELNPRGTAEPPVQTPAAAAPPVAPAQTQQPPPNDVARPGPSARRKTRLEQGGRPAPPPAPSRRPAAPQPPRGPGPAVMGSGQVGKSAGKARDPNVSEKAPTAPHATVPVASSAPAGPSSRRSLVEDALKQLKRRTDEKRKEKDATSASASAPKADAKPKPKAAADSKRRRRRLGKAEASDPRIAELYQAALTDLSDKKNP